MERHSRGYYDEGDLFAQLKNIGRGESFSRLIEGVEANGKTMTIYSYSKDSDLYKHFFARDLQFAVNAGCQYGMGTYALLELFGSAEAGVKYKDDTRKSLYGDQVYEFRVPVDGVFFLLFEEFAKTEKAKRLGSTQETYVLDQFKDLKLKLPSPEALDAMNAPMGKNNSNSKNAMAFFRHMSTAYTQNSDGTIESPVVGFVYRGGNDGLTAVIWKPYSLIPTRSSPDNGKTWTPMDENSDEFAEYIAAIEGEESGEEANVQRIYAGNKTPKKEQAYQAIMRYEADKGAFLGNFVDVVIKDDGTVDCTYKSSLPQLDDFEHYYRPLDCQAMRDLRDLGFKLGTVKGGIKFGSESGDPGFKISDAPEHCLPQRVTGPLKLVNMRVGEGFDGWEKRIGEKKLVMTLCEIVSDKDFDKFKEIRLTPDKPSWTTPEMKDELFDSSNAKWAKDLLTEKPEGKLKKKKESTPYNHLFERAIVDPNDDDDDEEEVDDPIAARGATKFCDEPKLYQELLSALGYDGFSVKKRASKETGFMDGYADSTTFVIESKDDKLLFQEFQKNCPPNKGNNLVLVDKKSNQSQYLNIQLLYLPAFVEKVKKHKRCQLLMDASGEPIATKNGVMKIKFNDKLLLFRGSHGDVGTGNAGELYEKWLFKILRFGAELNGSLWSKNLSPVEQQLCNEILKIKKNKDFINNSNKTFNALTDVIGKAFGSFFTESRERVGIYLTTKNSNPGKNMIPDLKRYADDTNATVQKIRKQAKRQINIDEVNSFNLMKKADIVVSVSAANMGLIYLPISIKLSEETGNGGERGEEFYTEIWEQLTGRPYPYDGYSLLNELVGPGKKMSEIKRQFFQEVVQDYAGDLGMIYAYGSSPVVNENTSTTFKFKVPKQVEVKLARYYRNEHQLVITLHGGAKDLFFSPSHKGQFSLKLASSGFNSLFYESKIVAS